MVVKLIIHIALLLVIKLISYIMLNTVKSLIDERESG